MKEIRIETGCARDDHASDRFLLARLEFSRSRMFVSIGGDRADESRHVCSIWEHTVFELENLAAALRFAAEGGLRKNYILPSPDMLIGPHVDLWPGIQVEVGHPGTRSRNRGAMFYCFAKEPGLVKRRLVFLDVILNHRGELAVFEVEDALALADRIYEQARSLAPKFVEGYTRTTPEVLPPQPGAANP